MNKSVRLPLFLFVSSLLTQPVLADYEKGIRALEAKDEQRAVEEFLQVAPLGDHRAMMALGALYAAGRGVPKDFAESLRWYREAARFGRSDAIYRIGLMFEGGYGTPENRREAAKYFLDAAKKGFAEAQLKVGTMYRDGDEFEKNPVRAYAWLKLAGDAGNADAAAALASVRETLTKEQQVEADLTATDYARKYPAAKKQD